MTPRKQVTWITWDTKKTTHGPKTGLVAMESPTKKKSQSGDQAASDMRNANPVPSTNDIDPAINDENFDLWDLQSAKRPRSGTKVGIRCHHSALGI